MAKRRGGYRNVNRLRRILRRIEPEMVAPLRATVKQTAVMIEQTAVYLVPVDEGDLRDSITHKVSRDGLTAVVGPGAKRVSIFKKLAGSEFSRRFDIKMNAATKKDLWQFTKGYWLEHGTKERINKETGASYGSISPRPFMAPAYFSVAPWAKRRIKASISRALKAARSKGGKRD